MAGIGRLYALIARTWHHAGEALRHLRRPGAVMPSGPVELGPRQMVPIVFHFARLEPQDRYRRFFGKVSFVTLFRRYSGIDWERTTFLGFEADGHIVGLAELSAADDPTGEVECAVSILKEWQRQGLGEALLAAAIDRVCRGQGRDMLLSTQRDNMRLIRLAKRLGAHTGASEGGIVDLVFRGGAAG